MIIKMQPKELDGKPLISEQEPGETETYMGRVIIEFWCENPEECEDTAFAWAVDDPAKPDSQWIELFLQSLKRATRHIEDTYRHRQQNLTP